MTDAHRRANLADELARATQALRAAEALADLGLASDSVSRSFYAVHHLLRALLFTQGVEPKTHAGALHLFNVHFVRVGAFATSHNRLIGSMQRARELADYDAAILFSVEDARGQLAEAQAFEREVRVHLAAGGWLAG